MTHAIFQGLQDDINNILCNLPDSVSPKIKLGLMDAHRKLSDYYYQFDASPFYIWAACMWFIIALIIIKLYLAASAGPTDFIWGRQADYADDPMLSNHFK